MKITVTPKVLSGAVEGLIASKSYAHRALIAAALADKPTKLVCNSDSEDIRATADCLEALGAKLTRNGDSFTVTPINEVTCGKTLNCRESGSTLRFLLPLTGALGSESELTGKGLLAQRPLSPMYEELISHGMEISPQGSFPLVTKGRLQSGSYKIAGNVSSQFITGLLFALPILEGDSEIAIVGELASRAYVDITLEVLADFGIEIEETDGGFKIRGNQKYTTPESYTVEGDWSSAAFWLAAGALSEEGISCAPLSVKTAQGDSRVTEILKCFGAKITVDGNTVTAAGGELKAIEFDAENIPDLVPVLSVVAAAAKGRTVIKNITRLKFKESDRIASTLAMLGALGIKAESDGENMVIHGGQLTGGRVESFADHRIVMSAAVAAVAASGEVEIIGAEHCSKSYPGFFEEYERLGGVISREGE